MSTNSFFMLQLGVRAEKSWLPLSDIPNEAGIMVEVLMKDGTKVKTKVRRSNKTGLHSLIDCRIKDAAGWRHRDPDQHEILDKMEDRLH